MRMRDLPGVLAGVGLSAIVVGGAGGTALGQTVTVSLTPVADNTLYEDFGGFSSNGAGVYLFAGKTLGGELRRSLLRFDLGTIPQGVQITSVVLNLRQSRQRDSTQPDTMTLHRVLQAWGEGSSNAGNPGGAGAPSQPGDATWIHTFFNQSFWTTPGGDFVSTPSSSASVGSALTTYSWTGAGMIADVAAWLANPSMNFGWVLLGNEAELQSARRFNSRENSTGRPELRVTYIIPTPGASALLGVAGLAALRRRRR
jgi:hypothetical protein